MKKKKKTDDNNEADYDLEDDENSGDDFDFWGQLFGIMDNVTTEA